MIFFFGHSRGIFFHSFVKSRKTRKISSSAASGNVLLFSRRGAEMNSTGIPIRAQDSVEDQSEPAAEGSRLALETARSI